MQDRTMHGDDQSIEVLGADVRRVLVRRNLARQDIAAINRVPNIMIAAADVASLSRVLAVLGHCDGTG